MKKKDRQKQDTYCQEIIRDCLWEYNMSSAEILEMAQNGSDQEKYFLTGQKADIPELRWNL